MKKLSLLISAALLVATISVQAQRVILRINNNYEVNIDGRYYDYNETVPALSYGTHTVKLYEVKPGVLGIGKRRKLLSSSEFELRNNDVIIEVDQYGKLRINEAGNYNNQRQNDDRNYDRNSGYENQGRTSKGNGKGYGPYNNPGRGHKYGLYKKDHNKDKKNNKHNKQQKNDRDDRDDDNDD